MKNRQIQFTISSVFSLTFTTKYAGKCMKIQPPTAVKMMPVASLLSFSFVRIWHSSHQRNVFGGKHIIIIYHNL